MQEPSLARNVHRAIIGLVVLLFAAVAFAANGTPAPGLGDLDPDWRAWFSSPLSLSITVGVFTSYAKTWLKLASDATRIAGLALGVALALFGHFVGALEQPLLGSVLFGLTAGIAAGGGWDILSGLVAIIAKVFGIVFVTSEGEAKDLPSPTASAVTPTRTVVIEKSEADVDVEVEVKKTRKGPNA